MAATCGSSRSAPQHAADLFAARPCRAAPSAIAGCSSDAPQALAEMRGAGSTQASAGPTRLLCRGDRQGDRQAPRAGRADAHRARARRRSRSAASTGAWPWRARRWPPRRCYLFARHVFDDLGYRRFEWKCNDRNEPSKAAAQRFGFQFEGAVPPAHDHQGREPRHRLVLDASTATGRALRAEYERWLAPGQFRCRRACRRRRLRTSASALEQPGSPATDVKAAHSDCRRSRVALHRASPHRSSSARSSSRLRRWSPSGISVRVTGSCRMCVTSLMACAWARRGPARPAGWSPGSRFR